MAKKSGTKKVTAQLSEEDLLFLEFDKAIQAASNTILKELKASPVTFEPKKGSDFAVSTDSLCLDLIMGGGAPRNRMTIFAGESYTGKTTVLQRVMKNSLGLNINSHYIDQEGSADPTWMLRNGFDFTNYILKPDVARKLTVASDINSGDDAFRYMSRICQAYAEIMAKNPEMYKKLLARGYASLAMFLDSLPACIPEALVEDDEKAAMAAQARMFSQFIPMVRTKLKNANAMFVTVNQLRTKPGVSFGDPDYEPGGNAPTFYSDVKVRFKKISKPKPVHGDGDHPLIIKENIRAGGIHQEFNPNGGEDKYSYVSFYTPKNRVFSPFLSTAMRIWVEEDGSPGRGIDPVFDVIHFYETLGMLTYGATSKGERKLTFEGKEYGYFDFKKEILTNPDLRARGHEMIVNGEAFSRFYDARSSAEEELEAPTVELDQETDEAFKAVEQEVKALEQAAGM